MIQLKMSINMPKCCYECPFDYDNIGCAAIKGDGGAFHEHCDDGWEETEQRLPNCPLEEISEL